MNIAETTCLNCPVRKTCPPEKRATRITAGIDPKKRTMDDATASGELSRLRQELYLYHCPDSERGKLYDPLKKRIHPNRQELSQFSTAARPHAAEDRAYGSYVREELHRKRKGTRP